MPLKRQCARFSAIKLECINAAVMKMPAPRSHRSSHEVDQDRQGEEVMNATEFAFWLRGVMSTTMTPGDQAALVIAEVRRGLGSEPVKFAPPQMKSISGETILHS